MKATKNPMTIMIEVKPEEVTDAVRGFAWYKMLANKPDFIPDPKEYVFGTCTFDEARRYIFVILGYTIKISMDFLAGAFIGDVFIHNILHFSNG